MITVEGVTKAYSGHLALDDVSFVARPGRVTGLLGAAGAGKSTVIRIMLGLTPATSGRVTIGGHRYRDLPNPGRVAGALLDTGARHDARTGHEIITVGAQIMGLPRVRVREVLEHVSLTPSVAKRRPDQYPPGVRQRLGIAHALLGNPAVLILDEPAKGMDATETDSMTDLLMGHATAGGTVLIASQLLNVMEKIADDLIVIDSGRIVAQGSRPELLASRGSYVEAVDHESLVDALRHEGIHTIRCAAGLRADADPTRIGTIAATTGLVLVALRPAPGLADLAPELRAGAGARMAHQRACAPRTPP